MVFKQYEIHEYNPRISWMANSEYFHFEIIQKFLNSAEE